MKKSSLPKKLLGALLCSIFLLASSIPNPISAAKKPASTEELTNNGILGRILAKSAGSALYEDEVSAVETAARHHKFLPPENVGRLFSNTAESQPTLSTLGRSFISHIVNSRQKRFYSPIVERAPPANATISDGNKKLPATGNPEGLAGQFDGAIGGKSSDHSLSVIPVSKNTDQGEPLALKWITRGKNLPERKDPTDDKVEGIGASLGSFLGSEISGINTYVHEGGHGLAFRAIRNPDKIIIQDDGFENFQNLIAHPSAENAAKFLLRNDVHSDGAAGLTNREGDKETGLSRALGENTSKALISAAGSLTQLVPAAVGYALGHKIRNKHPVLGYTMMSSSILSHVFNSNYLWEAVYMPPSQQIAGHDWVRVAKLTGINPAITALAYTASIPAEALLLYLADRRKMTSYDDLRALDSLLNKGLIHQSDLTALYENYPHLARLQKSERLIAALKGKSGDEILKLTARGPEVAAAMIGREFGEFQRYVTSHYRTQIKEEKILMGITMKPSHPKLREILHQTRELYKAQLQKDKVVALAGAGLMASGMAAGILATLKAAGVAAAGSALGFLMPGIGALTIALGAYNLQKTLRNRSVGRMEKIFSAVQQAFGMVGAGGLLTFNPLLMLAGLVGGLATVGARLIYKKLMEHRVRAGLDSTQAM